MHLLYFWRGDNYRRDLDHGVGFHLNQRSPRLHEIDIGEKGQLSRGVNKTPRGIEAPPTLAEAGIDKNLAKRARTLAGVPPEKFEKLLKDKRKRDNRRVTLDPEFQAEAEAAARDIEIERDERIALSGADALAAENATLTKQLAGLTRRIATLIEELGPAKYREKMWKERALEAGWKGRQNG